MKSALRFRRRMKYTVAGLLALLTFAFCLAYRSVGHIESMNRWAKHSQDVLRVIGDARLRRARLGNDTRAYLGSGEGQLRESLGTNRSMLRMDLARIEELTADNPKQQAISKSLRQISERYIEALQRIENGRGSLAPAAPDDAAMEREIALELREPFEKLQDNEQELLTERAGRLEKDARNTEAALIATWTLSVAIILGAGYLTQREILTRAQIEEGMRKAQELLGMTNEEQRVEIEQLVEDLHGQIRKRQQTDEEIRQLNEELENRVQERTAALEETNRELESFTYSVSHDLRAPLRHMDGFSKMLQEQYGTGLPDDGQHYLKRIRDAALHMSTLVEDLLHLSRIGRQALRRKTVSMSTIVQDARDEVLTECQGREIEWRIESLPDAEGDAGLMRLVATNLISNAVKFTRNKKRAVIEIGSRSDPSGETIYFVRDNGAGFDPRYADKLFGVFQRLHRQDEFEGTGVGLATVQRIIHKHGGKVWAESQPNQGATFYLTLGNRAESRSDTRETVGAAT